MRPEDTVVSVTDILLIEACQETVEFLSGLAQSAITSINCTFSSSPRRLLGKKTRRLQTNSNFLIASYEICMSRVLLPELPSVYELMDSITPVSVGNTMNERLATKGAPYTVEVKALSAVTVSDNYGGLQPTTTSQLVEDAAKQATLCMLALFPLALLV